MKIICVGRNYVNHIIELENEHPKNPLIFFKNSECLSNIKLFSMPQFSNNIHHEVELVFKICKSGKNIKVNDTKEYISHIALGIDFTARDIQNEYKAKGYPWSFSKNFDNSAPISRFIEINNFNDIKNINFSLIKNKELVQKGNSSLMIFNINFLLEYISKFITLQKGDILFSGTPEGVGNIKKGDNLEGFIEDEKLIDININ